MNLLIYWFYDLIGGLGLSGLLLLVFLPVLFTVGGVFALSVELRCVCVGITVWFGGFVVDLLIWGGALLFWYG